MARYTGPKVHVSRRLGIEHLRDAKARPSALEKRPYPPGEHGRTRRRGNVSEYLVQLQEKQKARFTYGLLEKQFRNLYEEANRQQGVTGENLLRFLELRLDNVVYRAGWARHPAAGPPVREPRPRRRSTASRVDIPSYRVRKGDVVTLRDKARADDRHPVTTSTCSTAASGRGSRPATAATPSPSATCPLREQIDVPVREQLIVELYSK